MNPIEKKQALGILITNLGTPKEADEVSVAKYLAEFLGDPRVIELPKWLWLPILHGIVLRTRPRKSAELYQKIWTAAGSPLLVNSKKLVVALNEILPNYLSAVKVTLGMRYGEPSIATALTELQEADINKLVILPLYPQYSATTTGSTFDAVSKVLKTWRYMPEVHFINQYGDNENYIAALVKSIENFWQQHSRGEKLLFSFHGLPKKSIAKGDPYYFSCNNTAALVAQKLQLESSQWQIVFQSRFGAQRWLQPYCDKTLKELAKKGVKKIDIVCPGFAADCLETLEEINIRNREYFLEAGGEQFNYIPALNDSDEHLQALSKILKNYC